MKRTPASARFVIPALLLVACGGDAGPSAGGPSWASVVDTVGDTVVVRTTSGQVWETNPALVSEVSIGVLDGEEKYQLGQVRAIAADQQGRIFAYDAHGPVLRVYGPDGTWLEDFGREGEGPGEIKRPDSGLSILPDGRVAVRDPGNARITLYSPEGEYLDYLTISGGFNTGNPMIADTAGALVTFIITNLGTSVFEWERGMARFNADGTVDTLPHPDLGYEEAMISGQREGSTSTSNVPFTAEQLTRYSPYGYYVVGVSEDYSFDLLRPEGVLRIQKPWEPVPVDPAEKAAERERIEDNYKSQFPGWKWNGPPIPDTKPAFDQFYLAEDGRIWVRIPAPGERYMDAETQREEEDRLGRAVNPFREPVVFDVFERTGEYLGQVETPEGFSVYPRPFIRDDKVWAVVRDEYDVQRIHRFRLEFVTADS